MVAPVNGTEDAPGTGWDSKRRNSELQDHVAFFDKDKDGIIWPIDTFIAFRELGFGYIWTILGVLFIHGAFSWITWGTLVPDPCFRLKVNRMHKAKHGSDTEVYTSTGEFDPDRFDYVFDMYTTAPHKHITLGEATKMVQGNRDAFDPFGWFCAIFEWIPLFIMLDPADGRLSRDDVKAVYDGSIFWRVAEQRRRKMKNLETKPRD